MASTTITASTSGRYGGDIPPTISWAHIWGGTTGEIYGLTDTNPDYLSGVMDTLTTSYWLLRSWLFFDLSGLPGGAVITAANLRIWVYEAGGTQEIKKFIITEGVQNDPIVHATDWVPQNAITTELGSVPNITSFTEGQYNEIDFNSTGLTFLNGKVGSTCKLCLRTERDIDNDPWLTVTANRMYFYLTQETGYEPELVLTYDVLAVTTQTCEDVVGVTSTGRGNITTLAGTVSAHGHCWNTSANPTTGNNVVDNGAASAAGTFTSAITSLTPGTGYYTRAYATNAVGTVYGDNVYFVASTGRAGYIWMESDDNYRGFDENAIERKYIHTDDVDDTPSNGATTDPISSNWAYDHENDVDAHGEVVITTEDSNTATSVDLALNMSAGEGINTTSGGSTVTIAGEDASTSNKGIVQLDDTAGGTNGEVAKPPTSNVLYDHANAADPHTGYVLESLFGAQTVIHATSNNTPIALTVTEQTLVGRLTGGNITAVALGISDNNVAQIDGTSNAPANLDYAKFTASGLEGRSYPEVLSDLSAEATASFSMNSQKITSLATPTLSTDATTKEYVDIAVSNLRWDYYWNNTGSGLDSYYEMAQDQTGQSEEILTTPSPLSGSGQAVFQFISDVVVPFTTVEAGVIDVHFHGKRATGNKSIEIYAEIYEYTSTPTELLIATTEVSTELTDSETSYSIHATLSTDYAIAATSKLLVKLLANMGTGSATTISIYVEGAHDSRVSVPVPTHALDDVYIRKSTFTQDSGILVGTGSGTFQEETGATLRTSIDTYSTTESDGLITTHTGLSDPHTGYFLLAGETTNAQLHNADLIVYSDAGSTEVARIAGATGNITTSGALGVTGTTILYGALYMGGVITAAGIVNNSSLNQAGLMTTNQIICNSSLGVAGQADLNVTLIHSTLGVAGLASFIDVFVTNNITVGGTVDGIDVSAHDIATTGVHGVGGGAIVGTTLSQTLTNKTLTAPAINGTVTTTGLTLPAFTLDGTVSLNSQIFSGAAQFDNIIWCDGGLYLNADGIEIRAYNSDGGYAKIMARETGVNPQEVARFVGAVAPYFRFGVTDWNIKIQNNIAGIFFGDSTDSWDLLLSWRDATTLKITDSGGSTLKTLELDYLWAASGILLQNAGVIQPFNTTNGHQYHLTARDVDGAAWRNMLTVTNANDPTLAIGGFVFSYSGTADFGSNAITNATLTSPTINGTIATTGLTLPTFAMGGAAITGHAQAITDNVIVTVDGSPSDDEYAKWTADGLEGRTYANVRTDINVADGADVTGSNPPQAHEASHVSGGSDDIDAALNPAAVALTTRGDVLFHDASGLARLAKGSSGDVLTMGANDPAWAAGGAAAYGQLTVKGFQFNPATGDFAFDSQNININDVAEVASATGVNEYAEVILPAALRITQWRGYGSTNNNGDGVWKIQYLNGSDVWTDWQTGISTRATGDWSGWDSTGGEVVALGIKLVATTIDTKFTRSFIGELEVKY